MGRKAKSTTIIVAKGLNLKTQPNCSTLQAHAHIGGKSYRKGMGTADIARAIEIALEWHAALVRGELPQPVIRTVSWQRLVSAYKATLREDAKGHYHGVTIRRHFSPYFGKFADIRTITSATINAYLLDRDHMPGSLVKRQPCEPDLRAGAARDRSLLAPESQPQFGTRGPLNVFGPYSERYGMGDHARSRTTPAYFRDQHGRHFVFVTGNAKSAEESAVDVGPGIARLEVVTPRAGPPHLRLDSVNPALVLRNPGSPFVSSNGARAGIVWLTDVNAPRSASLYGPDAPRPVLYALDANTLDILWRTLPGELHPGGKYNEPRSEEHTSELQSH